MVRGREREEELCSKCDFDPGCVCVCVCVKGARTTLFLGIIITQLRVKSISMISRQ